tara:strand:- start:201 stop:530 length:330 start_codon:yes stop_codon:yes gene_type:complete
MNTRKKRKDRNHIIYKITCLKTKERYIGLTLQVGQKKIGSANIRLKSHISRAKNGGGWKLHERIREIGPQYFTTEVVDIVRGKTEAHLKEVYYIGKFMPELNVRRKYGN